MAEKQITIRIAATDSFSTVISRYNEQIGKATRETKDFDDASKKSGGGVDNLTSSINTMAGAFILTQGLNMVGEMIEIGQAANAADRTFVSLSGGVTQAANNMQLLRDATRGTVDDMSLQQGASKMFAMQLANTGEEAARMANVAVTLGRAMGTEAAPAMENFSLMLANQSLLRLDTYGISSAAVRERMKELAAEFPNLDKQARFTTATMEIAEQSIGRLGDAAGANATNIDKFKTSLANIGQDIGQSVTTVVDQAAGSLMNLAGIIGEIGKHGIGDVFQAGFNTDNFNASAIALPLADAAVEVFDEFMHMADVSSAMNGNQMQEWLGRAFTLAELDPNKNWENIISEMMGAPFDPSNPAMVGTMNAARAAYEMVASEAAILSANQARELSRFAAYAGTVGTGMSFDEMQAQNYQSAKYGAYADMYSGQGATNPMQQWGEDAFGGGDVNGLSNLIAQMEGAQTALDNFQSNAGGMGSFIDAGAMEGINAQFEKLQELNEQGLITDDNLAKAEEFKQQAEDAAKAFEDMSLTDIFGQTSGGMEGEIGDLVIKKMQDEGASPEAIAAAQRTFNLGSGRETGASVAMQDTLAPMLADLAETDPATAQLAIENIDKFLKAAALMELTPEQIAGGLPGAAGLMPGAGGQFTVLPGQGIGQVAGQYGMTPQAVMGAAGNGQYIFPGTYPMGNGLAPDPNFDPNAYAQGIGGTIDQSAEGAVNPLDMAAVATDKMKDNTADIVDQVDQIATGADAVTKAMDMAAAPRTMQITVETIDKTGGLLKAMLGGLQGGTIQLGGSSVRDAGGRVAGQDSRVGQKPGFTK